MYIRTLVAGKANSGAVCFSHAVRGFPLCILEGKIGLSLTTMDVNILCCVLCLEPKRFAFLLVFLENGKKSRTWPYHDSGAGTLLYDLSFSEMIMLNKENLRSIYFIHT